MALGKMMEGQEILLEYLKVILCINDCMNMLIRENPPVLTSPNQMMSLTLANIAS